MAPYPRSNLPDSSPTPLVLALATAVAVLGGCASTGGEPVPPPSGTFGFEVEVEGVHQWESGQERFREKVSGQLEFASDQVFLASSHGSCREDLPERGSSLVVSCGNVRVRVSWRGSQLQGTVSVPLRETEVRRGACARFDANRACLEWTWEEVTRTAWRSSDFTAAVLTG